MIDDYVGDPIAIEERLALNAYLCFCSAWGCFYGSMQAYWVFSVYLDEMFWMAGVFATCGFVLLALSRFRVPTEIWKHHYLKRRKA